MTNFEFVFSLFGLLMGLSLAEVLRGFGRAVKARGRVRIGWLTPLLGMLVMLDLTSFWINAWQVREAIEVNYLTLMLLLILTCLYYLAATMVFPETPDTVGDFDAHFWANKRLVLLIVLGLNIPNYIGDFVLSRIHFSSAFSIAVSVTFLLLMVLAVFARGTRLNVIVLAALVSLYPLSSTVSAVRMALAG